VFLLHVAGKMGELEHVLLLLLWKNLRESDQGWSLDAASVSRREGPLVIQVGCYRSRGSMRMVVLTGARLVRTLLTKMVTLKLSWGEENGQGVGMLVAALVIKVVLGQGRMVVSIMVLSGEKIVVDLQRSETSTNDCCHLDVG